MRGVQEGLGKRKEEKNWKGRGDNEGLRPSETHGSGCTSVCLPPASSCLLHSVWALSHCPGTASPQAGGGGGAFGICKLLFFFSFPLSLRLCADSHVGELIKLHVLLPPLLGTTRDRQQGAPQPRLWMLGSSEALSC